MFGKNKNGLRTTKLATFESLENRELFAADFGFASAAYSVPISIQTDVRASFEGKSTDTNYNDWSDLSATDSMSAKDSDHKGSSDLSKAKHDTNKAAISNMRA